MLECENGATLGSLSDKYSAGKAAIATWAGAAKRGLASEGARQKASARATKKKTASTFSLSIDPDNWLTLPTNSGGPGAGKLDFRMLKKANKQKRVESKNYIPTFIDLNRQVNRNEHGRKVHWKMTQQSSSN